MGFDASAVGLGPDARRVLHDTLRLSSVNNALRQHRKLAREISNADRMFRSFGGMDQVVRDANSSRNLALSAARVARSVNFVGANTASLYADLARRAVPESLRRGLPGFGGILAGLSYQTRMQNDALRYGKMFGNLGLSSSVAQAFEAHGLASSYGEGWRLQAMRATRPLALQSILKATSTFGPIVVLPDYDDETPFEYSPDLQGWLIPETATESEEAIDVEELWAAVVAWTQGIAVHHHTEALLNVMGNGRRFLIRVSQHPTVAEMMGSCVGAYTGYEIGGAIGAAVGGGAGPLIAYVLARR